MMDTTLAPPQEDHRPALRVVRHEDDLRDAPFDVIPFERLQQARSRHEAESFWAGRVPAMRRSARVAA
jgi:hypothetical protein